MSDPPASRARRRVAGESRSAQRLRAGAGDGARRDMLVLALGRVPEDDLAPALRGGGTRRSRRRVTASRRASLEEAVLEGDARSSQRVSARLSADPDRTVRSRSPQEASVIVPELPSDIRELKERVGRFVEEEVYPLEQRSRRRLDRLRRGRRVRRKARAAGFAMLNMPAEHGGEGPLDARPGRARGGDREGDERARLRRRRPRPAGAARDRDAAQAEQLDRADHPGRVPRGLGGDRAGRGLRRRRNPGRRRPETATTG